MLNKFFEDLKEKQEKVEKHLTGRWECGNPRHEHVRYRTLNPDCYFSTCFSRSTQIINLIELI